MYKFFEKNEAVFFFFESKKNEMLHPEGRGGFYPVSVPFFLFILPQIGVLSKNEYFC